MDKREELEAKIAELKKALEAETNGQKKGGITRSLKAVQKQLDGLDANEVPVNDDAPEAANENAEVGNDHDVDPSASSSSVPPEDETSKVEVRSKTGANYRRCGKVFGKVFKPVSLTDAELEKVKADPWLVVKEA